MLQFRASIVLKELIQTSPKRSFSDIIRHKKTSPNAYCFSAAYRDDRIFKLKIVYNGRPFIQPLAGRRFLCTKTDGAIEPTEPVKKDETVQEATADKYEIYICHLVVTHMIFKVIDQKYMACVQHTRQNIPEWLTTWRCVYSYTFTASGWRTCVVV